MSALLSLLEGGGRLSLDPDLHSHPGGPQRRSRPLLPTLPELHPPMTGGGTCPSWKRLSVWLWMALTFHFGSHEINWSSLSELQALRHGNENIAMAILQEIFVWPWMSTEVLSVSMPTCLINEGATLYVGHLLPPLSFLRASLLFFPKSLISDNDVNCPLTI